MVKNVFCRYLPAALIASLFCAASLHAGSGHRHEHGASHQHGKKSGHHHHPDGDSHKDKHQHTHGAHVHGLAKLTLLQEGEQLLIQLESPAMNIVGFEHAPRNAQAQEAVRQAAARLENIEGLLALPAEARCQLQSAHVSSELIDYLAGGEQGGHGHHAEFHAEYHLQCDRAEQIKGLHFPLFGDFPGIEKLHVQWITDGGQGARTLDASNPAVRLR